MAFNPDDAPPGYTATPATDGSGCLGCAFIDDPVCGPSRRCTPLQRADGAGAVFVKAPALGAVQVARDAQALAAAARAAGLVLTIEQVPTPGEPLSMGRHIDVVSVREAR